MSGTTSHSNAGEELRMDANSLMTRTVSWQTAMQVISVCLLDSRAACLVQTELTFVMSCCGGTQEAVQSARAAM